MSTKHCELKGTISDVPWHSVITTVHDSVAYLFIRSWQNGPGCSKHEGCKGKKTANYPGVICVCSA